MRLSHNEQYFAVISGHTKIMDEKQPEQMLIYLVDAENKQQPFQLIITHDIGARDEFKDISMQFHFKIPQF